MLQFCLSFKKKSVFLAFFGLDWFQNLFLVWFWLVSCFRQTGEGTLCLSLMCLIILQKVCWHLKHHGFGKFGSMLHKNRWIKPLETSNYEPSKVKQNQQQPQQKSRTIGSRTWSSSRSPSSLSLKKKTWGTFGNLWSKRGPPRARLAKPLTWE